MGIFGSRSSDSAISQNIGNAMSNLNTQTARNAALTLNPTYGVPIPTSPNRDDLTNRLLQIMSGNLGGTLSGGEKLSALGALLKSVSRGSQTSPQDVVRGIQQQKMQEVQGALQIQELRKTAAERAKTEKQRQILIDQETDPQRKAYLATVSPEAIDKIAIQQFTSAGPASNAYEWFAKAYGEGTPAYNEAVKAYIERQQTFAGPGGAIYTQQPVSLPSLPTSTNQAYDPRRAQALAILKSRGAI